MKPLCPCDRDKEIDPVCTYLGECSSSRLDEDEDDSNAPIVDIELSEQQIAAFNAWYANESIYSATIRQSFAAGVKLGIAQGKREQKEALAKMCDEIAAHWFKNNGDESISAYAAKEIAAAIRNQGEPT